MWHLVPLHTRVWRDALLVSLLYKLYKLVAYKRRVSSLDMGLENFGEKNTERSSGFRVRVHTYLLSLFFSLCVLGVLVHTIAHKHLVLHLPLATEVLRGWFWCFGAGFKPRRAVGASFVKVIYKGEKLPFYSPFLHCFSTYLRAIFVLSV